MQQPRSLADRYQLVAHVARGGMADVFEAHDTMLGRRVAVKILHQQFSVDETFVARFRKEAQAAANLSHPNIVSIYDWGEDEHTYFIVMELIKGRSLRDVLRSEGSLLPRRAAEIAAEVASALEVAHRNRVIHRDNKPGNILLAADGTVKVTDFGIARAWDDSQELTKTGSVIGTATYFSPEQAKGELADARSDVYSLGVVLYEMLVGAPPFSGETSVSVAYQHVSEPVPPPSQRNPDVPPQLEVVAMKALEKNPDRRYQSADDMRRDLLRFLQGDAIEEEPVAPVAGTPPIQADAPTQVISRTDTPPPTVPPDEAYRRVTAEERRPSQLPFVVTAVGLLVALVIGVFILFNNISGGGTSEPLQVQVPETSGKAEADARLELQNLNFRVTPVQEASTTFEAGTVIRTEPRAGDFAEEGTFVEMFVSAGPEPVVVPDVTQSDRDRAEALLSGQGFVVVVEEALNNDVPAGVVISQDPPGTTEAAPDSTVTIVVSLGPETILLDDFRGRSENDVVFTLSGLGLTVEIDEASDDDIAPGFVIRTNPAAGTEVRPGDTVTIVLSTGPEIVQVPDFFGLTAAEAQELADSFGLLLRVADSRTAVTTEGLHERVATQNPDANFEVTRGTTITVSLGEYTPPETTTTTVADTTTTTTTSP